ncbi:hypothetical protein [Limnohabitans radicicola]|jgi:hypothetical protein|uniref:Uncharacterized protein n=1 Tax=Limnohabitans radicicola TaxID=2771427 RepID=A0A927IMD0_9BURK|nr:hypothetical protein [Limnohabitans radicicola]MBD8050872.1 hypothetical protein [Limnohabitans radicicola]
MSIHQLSVSHDERQDRLLWRLNTLDGQEFQFWLTRRMLTRLWPAMNQSLLKWHASAPGLAASDTISLQMLRDFKRDNLMASADFKTPFASGAKEKPLGQEPLLVTDAHLSMDPQGGMGLLLEQKIGEHCKSCQLNLSVDLVEGLLLLTQQALQSADWALPTTEGVASEAASPAEVTPPTAQSYKH